MLLTSYKPITNALRLILFAREGWTGNILSPLQNLDIQPYFGDTKKLLEPPAIFISQVFLPCLQLYECSGYLHTNLCPDCFPYAWTGRYLNDRRSCKSFRVTYCNCAAFQDDPTRKDLLAATYPTRPAARNSPRIKVIEGDGMARWQKHIRKYATIIAVYVERQSWSRLPHSLAGTFLYSMNLDSSVYTLWNSSLACEYPHRFKYFSFTLFWASFLGLFGIGYYMVISICTLRM